MSQYFVIHREHPQMRLVRQAAAILADGGVAVYPTDTVYALACGVDAKQGLDRIVRIRQLHKNHKFTIACKDLSEISAFARVSNSSYRVLKHYTPGPFTFLLPASRDVPKRIITGARRSIGIRVPGSSIAGALLDAVGAPLLTTTLWLPGDDFPLADPDDIRERVGKQVDVIIDGGHGGLETTTVVDLRDDVPVVLREGAGDFE